MVISGSVLDHARSQVDFATGKPVETVRLPWAEVNAHLRRHRRKILKQLREDVLRNMV
ncbi:hypothetical protein D9M69_685700 [compost metagenome]